ncbi:ROK family protein [Pontixanthobacter gangjinensis]|uniref:ROK family protein n=1 Tax=Christiangramia aestuarii TaxID=1028746 RepID=A0A7K1LRG3_9FLAO|nr:ROK family protein [Christiangramia aestuarii]MUP43387.1 ROK family protein [Christiangramia aestuarii]
MNNKILGVDIGGTKVQVGVVQDSKVVKKIKFPTLSGASKEDIIQNLIQGIESLGTESYDGIGIGVPGLVDEKNGIVYDLLNISSWKEVYLKQHLEDHFNIPVKITNDANVFALGEKIFGQGTQYSNLVGITMGTGFGMGIIANDELYSGSFSSAGEIGSIKYLDKTVEDYCSGKFFKNQFDLRGTEVFERAEKGDAFALEIMEQFGQHLAQAIKTVLFILSPQAILLGGSISQSFKYFEKSLWDSLKDFPFKRVTDQLVIKASNMENIPILGAAALIVSENRDHQEYISKNKSVKP